MITVRNTGPDRQASWCILPAHWSSTLHDVGSSSAQSDAFDGFEVGLPDVMVMVDVPSGSLLTFDDQQLNGPLIQAAVTALGMEIVG